MPTRCNRCGKDKAGSDGARVIDAPRRMGKSWCSQCIIAVRNGKSAFLPGVSTDEYGRVLETLDHIVWPELGGESGVSLRQRAYFGLGIACFLVVGLLFDPATGGYSLWKAIVMGVLCVLVLVCVALIVFGPRRSRTLDTGGKTYDKCYSGLAFCGSVVKGEPPQALSISIGKSGTALKTIHYVLTFEFGDGAIFAGSFPIVCADCHAELGANDHQDHCPTCGTGEKAFVLYDTSDASSAQDEAPDVFDGALVDIEESKSINEDRMAAGDTALAEARKNNAKPETTDNGRTTPDELPDYQPMGALAEFWAFLRIRKKFWLAPIIIVLLILCALMWLSGSAGIVSPFIYAL